MTINTAYTVPIDSTLEVNNLYLDSNAKLTVNGILVVHGNLTMANNAPEFSMGGSSIVIVYGDFIASNKMTISVSSYLIIHGNFTKSGSTNQGDLNVDDGNIYIFGDENWDELTTCGDGYDGNTLDTTETCDYGTEDDYEDNQDDLPEELIELVNCYDLSSINISPALACPASTVSISVAEANLTDVHYQWQVRIPGGTWNPTTDDDTNDAVLLVKNVTQEDSGNQYRLVVKPTAGSTSSCQISISKIMELTVDSDVSWVGTTSTDWNTPSNWKCNLLPTIETNVIIPSGIENYPRLSAGAIGKARNIEIASGASVHVVGNELQIAGTINNSGSLVAEEGTISMVGDSTQTIPAGTFVGNKIKNLISNNPANVTLGGVLYLTGIIKVTQGAFFSGGFLTLVSDEVQTALIDGAGSGQVIGAVKMQRYFDNSFGYKYFSSPFQNTAVGDFAAYIDLNESFPNFYSYNENREDINGNDATGWEVYTEPTATLNAVEGYALNFGDSTVEKTVEISGTVNNGSYSRTLFNNNGEYTNGFNLVGNPYPSPIDWDAANGWTRTNVDDAIYFFTAGTTDRYTGTYTSYVNGVQSNDAKSSNIIPSMQGFFVHVSDITADDSPTIGTLAMTNEVRSTDVSQDFLKSREKKNNHSLIRITAGFENEGEHDPTVVYFVQNATPNFEKGLDAHKLMNTALNVSNFYSLTPEGDKLAISAIALPDTQEAERIPLGIKSEKAGWMAITLKDVENLFLGSYIYLLDEEKRTVQDLNSKPIYRFQAKKGETNSRFYLIFSNSKISDPAIIYNKPFSVEADNGRVLVRMNLKEGERGPLQVSTVTGQIIDVLQVAEKEVVEIQKIRSTGVYFISFLSGKETFTKKVLVKQ